MEKLNWNPEKDRDLKDKEVEIHNEYHRVLIDQLKSENDLLNEGNRGFRINALNKALNKIGENPSGAVLEIGAGDGWCSVYMLKNFNKIAESYIMEINDSAIDGLIPHSLKLAGVDDKNIKLVKGSFNNIVLKNHFNFVVAMGAIHHSSNLQKTFDNIYDSLKPGGWFIAQEPSMLDNTSNNYYFKREKEEVDFKGILKVKNEERSDIFYRNCEFMTAAYHSGFEYYSELLPKKFEKKNIFKKSKPVIETTKPNNILIICQKPLHNYNHKPVTRW